MKRSKRILASLMSVLLVLPSLVLPFSATAEETSEPEGDQRIVAVLQEEESTGTATSGFVGKQYNDVNISLEKAPSNYIVVGEYKLNVTEPVPADDGWMDYVLGSGDIKAWGKKGEESFSTVCGQMEDFIPVAERAANEWMPFEIPLADFESDTLTSFQLNLYNDLESKLGQKHTLEYSLRKVYVMDVSIRADGTPNPVVADISGSYDVVTAVPSAGLTSLFPTSKLKTNSMSSDMDVSKLRVEFDVMVEEGDVEASTLKDGTICLWAHDEVGDKSYNSPAWSGPVEQNGTWYHISYSLDQFKNNDNTIADPSTIYQAQINDYNHTQDTPSFTAHVKNFRIVDTEMERLAAAVDEAEARLADGKDYIEEAVAALNEKLAAAKALRVEATQAQVTEAADALETALAQLRTVMTYPNADPDELYYVVGRFQEKDAVKTKESVIEEGQATDPTIAIDTEEPIDLSAYGKDRSKLALMLDVKVDRKDGVTGKDALKSTANQFVELQDRSNAAAPKSVFKTSGSSKPYLGGNYTDGYEDSEGEWVTYLVPWSMTLSEHNTDKVTRFFYGMYNDTTDVALTISIRNARIVDFTRDGEGYANGVVGLMYPTGMDATPDTYSGNKHSMEAFSWKELLFNSMTSDMNPADLCLEFETKASGEGQASKIANGRVVLQCQEDGGNVDYQVSSWTNGKMPQNDIWYPFSYTLDTLKKDNVSMTDPSRITKFYVQSYNDNKDADDIPDNQDLLVMNQIIRNARIIDLTVVQPREDLEAAVNELNDCLFDENTAAEEYDAAVAKGKELLADRDATPQELAAQAEAINEAKKSLSNIVDVTYDVAHFSSQEKMMNTADVSASQFYYNWAAADGTTDAGIDLTDGSENVIGQNRYFQLKVTFTRNASYEGTTTFEDIDILNNVQVRLRSSDVEGVEHRSDSFTLAITDKQKTADQVVYTLEVQLNDANEATGDRKDMNWKDLRNSIIFVNLTSPLWTSEENKQDPVAIECTLSDVQIVNKTLPNMIAELTTAANEVLADESQYTEDSVADFKAAQEAAKLVLADDAATARAIRAAAADVTQAKENLKDAPAEPVPDNYILIGEGPVTSNEAHDFGAAIEPAEAVDLSEYTDRDLSVTYKIKVDKTERFPTSEKIEGNNWLTKITNGSFKVNGENVLSGLSLSKGIYSGVTAENVWVDVTVALPKGITSISKVEARFFNDLHKLTSNDNDQKQGVTISIKDAYVVVGDVSPIMRWSQQERTITDLNGGYQFYFDWKTADGVSGQASEEPGIDLSDATEENVANADYAFQMDITYNVLKTLPEGITPIDMMGLPIINLRSTQQPKEEPETGYNEMATGWFTIPAEYCTAKADGTGYTVSIPLTAITTGNLDWSDVKELLVRQEVKDEADYRTGGYISMTLANVKVVEVEAEPEPPVDKEALTALIATAKEKASKTDMYTAGSIAALNTAITNAQGVVDNDAADQAAVNAQVAALQDAINALVDISGLKALLDGKKNEEQLAGYTADSVEAYNKLFTDAQAVYENPNATAQQVAEQVEILEGADSVLVEETPDPDDNVVDITTGETTTVEGHMLNVAVSPEEPIDLSAYANREVSLQFQIKLDKTENFAETLNAFVDGDNWMSYIRNGRVRVNGSEIGDLQATVGLLSGMTEGEYVTVTVQIPQAIVEQGTLTGYEMYMYNDLHRFGEDMDPEAETNDGTYTEANEGSKGVTMTVKDVKLVIGDELPAQDPNAKMVWSTIVGDYNTLQGGTQVYIDWKSADGYPLDTEEGPGADLSGTAANGANKNYNLQIKFTFKDVNLPENVTIDQVVKLLFVRLRSSRIDDAEKAAKGLEFTLKAEGDGERLVLEPDADEVYSINVPLSMMVTENIDWTDVKQMIIRMEIADEYTGTANMTNPYFTLSIQEAKIVDTDPENPDVPVDPTVDKTKLEALIETAQAEAAKTDTYTADSIAALEDAIDAAQAVVDDAEATQEDVDAQLTALQAAIDELDEIPVTPEPELGDVNGDGKITAMDALMALQAATGKIDLTDEQKVAANVNGDEEVTAEDALVLLQYATQKISKLPHTEPVEEPAE